MKVRLTINQTKQLKRMSYRILRKMHELERGRKVSRVYSKKCKAEACVSACLIHLRELLDISFTAIELGDDAAIIERYLSILKVVIREVRQGAETSTKLHRGTLAKLLTAHTAAFNLILRKGINLPIGPDVWSNVVLPAIAVWGDKI